MKKRKYIYEAQTQTPSGTNPLSVYFLPDEPPTKRPKPEKIIYKSSQEIISIHNRTDIVRLGHNTSQPGTATETHNHSTAPNINQILPADMVDDNDNLPEDDFTYVSRQQPALNNPNSRNFELFVSARMRKVDSSFRLGVSYRMYSHRQLFHSNDFTFQHYIDRCQGTQFAITKALKRIAADDLSALGPPRKVSIITDELNSSRFIEHCKNNITELEGELMSAQMAVDCDLAFRRPADGDSTFNSVMRDAIETCRKRRPNFSYFKYNKKYVNRVANAWATASTNERYRQDGSPVMKKFFAVASWIPTYLSTTFVQTQFFSGHGCFRAYLKRFGLRASDACVCDNHPSQTVEHVLLECDRYSHYIKDAFALAGLRARCLSDLVDKQQAYTIFEESVSEIHKLLMLDNANAQVDGT